MQKKVKYSTVLFTTHACCSSTGLNQLLRVLKPRQVGLERRHLGNSNHLEHECAERLTICHMHVLVFKSANYILEVLQKKEETIQVHIAKNQPDGTWAINLEVQIMNLQHTILIKGNL